MLKIGKINYLNVFPLYRNLENNLLVQGEPSYLNKLLNKGKIDISPSSSFEYLNNHENYLIINDLSISGKRKVLSVNFISAVPIEELTNETVYLSPASFTSNILIKIILLHFYKKKCNFKMLDNNMFSPDINQILIGDSALDVYFNRKQDCCHIYDLAELWYNFTNLPFVFALWLVNRNSIKEKEKLIQQAVSVIQTNKTNCFIPKKYKNFTESQIKEYFSYIDYNLSDNHLQSLKLFAELCYEYKFTKDKAEFKFL